jgi:transposase-like protein
MPEQKSQAEMLELILKVRNREITAKKAAALLGISRKTYYKWEDRALAGMAVALAERPDGRPPGPPEDPEKESLRKENERLKQENLFLQKRLQLKDIIHSMTTGGSQSSKKK